MQFEEATKDIGEVAISDSSGNSSANTARCKPAVALETATAYLAPTYLATCASYSAIFLPCVRDLNLTCHKTLNASDQLIVCFPYGIKGVTHKILKCV